MRNNKNNSFKATGYPYGVQTIKEMEKDPRKVSNLFNGKGISKDYEDIWLTLKTN